MTQNDRPRVVVCGARRHRQGIGEFVAHWFTRGQADVCAIVGTTDATVSQTVAHLRTCDIACTGYTSLEKAMVREKPDIVCLCTPYRFHREHLAIVADIGAHCLCEKPFWWEASPDRKTETEKTIDPFLDRGYYLQLITQWPYTLPFFYALYPQLKRQPIECFDMTMGPISSGVEMVLDAAPHLLSMLDSLVGPGTIVSPRATYRGERNLQLEFEYVHAQGSVSVHFHLLTTEKPPRPARYAINGCIVERKIGLPEYSLYFDGNGQRVNLEDPLYLLILDFLKNVAQRTRTDRRQLVSGITGLEALVRAAS